MCESDCGWTSRRPSYCLHVNVYPPGRLGSQQPRHQPIYRQIRSWIVTVCKRGAGWFLRGRKLPSNWGVILIPGSLSAERDLSVSETINPDWQTGHQKAASTIGMPMYWRVCFRAVDFKEDYIQNSTNKVFTISWETIWKENHCLHGNDF